MNYYRYPGYSPHYSRFETALYVSRKARLMRGFAMSPTRHNGNKYYFRSTRGPMKDMGNWIVTVNPDGGGGGGGDYFDPTPATSGCGWFDFNGLPTSYSSTYALPDTGQVPVGTPESSPYNVKFHAPGVAGWVPGQRLIVIGTYTGAFEFDNWSGGGFSQINKPFKEYTAGTCPVTGRPYATRTVEVASPRNIYRETYHWAIQFDPEFAGFVGRITIRFAASYRTAGVVVESHYSNSCNRFENASGYNASYYTHPNPSGIGVYGSFTQAIEGVYWAEPGDVTTPATPLYVPGAGGGGGGGDSNEVNCSGDAAYSCTCPDYTAEEHPYWDARTRTLTRYRSWAGGNWAGIQTLGFPCKHIISVAYKRHDWPNLFCWARAASNDLPARELWQQARDSYLEYRDRYWAERDRDAARAADRRRARYDQYQRDEWDRRLEPRRELQAQISGVYARIKELSEPMDWQYALTDAGKREAMQRDRERQELTGQLKDLTLQVEAFDAQLDRERANRALIDSGHTIKYGTPPPSASAGERMQAAIDQLSKVDDTARFIANEGAKYGWGSNVSGADPFAPPQYLE